MKSTVIWFVCGIIFALVFYFIRIEGFFLGREYDDVNIVEKLEKFADSTLNGLILGEFGNYVETNDALITNKTLSILTNKPAQIDINDTSWKIWAINFWIYKNIQYIDESGDEEIPRYAHEILQRKKGDCDDFAILQASMYESAGLDAMLVFMQTEDDDIIIPNHLACLVYYPDDGKTFLDDEEDIMDKTGIELRTNKMKLKYISAETSTSATSKYLSGIWIFADVPMSDIKDLVGYISNEPYKVLNIYDVGK